MKREVGRDEQLYEGLRGLPQSSWWVALLRLPTWEPMEERRMCVWGAWGGLVCEWVGEYAIVEYTSQSVATGGCGGVRVWCGACMAGWVPRRGGEKSERTKNKSVT